jgi:hypothetical protein
LLALLIFASAILAALVLSMLVFEGDFAIAIVPGWGSPPFWLSAVSIIMAVFTAGFFWKFRRLSKRH